MALWENVIGYGPHAARPAAGAVGALYFESDTGNGYRDNGLAWDHIMQPPWTVDAPSADTTLTRANVLIVCTGLTGATTITLPPVATVPYQAIEVRNGSAYTLTLAPASGDAHDAPADGVCAAGALRHYRCDATSTWYRTS